MCSLRFASLRARGDTDGELRWVTFAPGGRRDRVVRVTVFAWDLGPSKSAGLRFAAQHPRQPPVIHDCSGSQLTRILRHGARSPADLLGAGGLMRTRSRQQLERDILLSQRAHEMRSNATRSESALWAALSRVRYRSRLRLLRFIHLMDEGRSGLKTAAIAAGFGSYSQCHRFFQFELGCCPRQFFRAGVRKQMRQAYELDESASLNGSMRVAR